MIKFPKQATIYLNRECPRRCPYCDITLKQPKNELTVNQWNEAFNLLRERGVEFFLILGTEPLVMGDKIVEIVDFLDKEHYNYGFYTTSPEPYFTNLMDKLINAGIKNWSSGIDFVDEVYENGKWSALTNELVKLQRNSLVKKAEESLKAMKIMEPFVEELLVLITISKMNIEMVPKMIIYFVENLKNVHIGLNFVEWSKEKGTMDFAKNKTSGEYFFSAPDVPMLAQLRYELFHLDEKYKKHIQTPLSYFNNITHILNLDYCCKWKNLSVGVDYDGTLRLCGYKKLSEVVSVFDMENNYERVLDVLYMDWNKCKGCYWAYPYILEQYEIEGVKFDSNWWKERLK